LAAVFNWLFATSTKRVRPSIGRFLRVRGETLHYLDRGEGKALLLLHGNGSAVEDFTVSGLLERCAVSNRVIAFDRPGFGLSSRNARRLRRPEEQADLLAAALRKLGVEQTVIFAHSWGTLVALAMALRYPNLVSSLVLASGYYFPTLRPDALLFSLPGLPVIGNILSYTIWPLASRLTWKLAMNRLFAPAPISQEFSACLEPLTLRPKTVRAMGEDTAAMIPAAKRLSVEYGHVGAPVTVIAGEDDRIVSPEQSRRLQSVMRLASLDIVPGVGHMVHHSAVDEVAAVIERRMIHANH
jgi:pimeloyl-ACP methyl ester carboxylesterase